MMGLFRTLRFVSGALLAVGMVCGGTVGAAGQAPVETVALTVGCPRQDRALGRFPWRQTSGERQNDADAVVGRTFAEIRVACDRKSGAGGNCYRWPN